MALISCSDDDSSPTTNSNPGQVVATATEGTWRVSSFIDDTDDETTNFNGYNFTFAANGVVTATNAVNTYSGTWSVSDSDSSDDDDSSSDDVDFNINFTTPAAFADLSDDWDIQETTATTIKLIDISGGNGGTDYLVFTKN